MGHDNGRREANARCAVRTACTDIPKAGRGAQGAVTLAAAITMCITLVNAIQFVFVMQMHVASARHLYLHVQCLVENICVGNGGGKSKPMHLERHWQDQRTSNL